MIKFEQMPILNLWYLYFQRISITSSVPVVYIDKVSFTYCIICRRGRGLFQIITVDLLYVSQAEAKSLFLGQTEAEDSLDR